MTIKINEIIFMTRCFSLKILFPDKIDQKIEKDLFPAVMIEAGAYKYARLSIVPPTPLDKDWARNSFLNINLNGFILNLYIDIINKNIKSKTEVIICWASTEL